MKKVLLPFLVILGFCAKAQTFNNTWIDYNKTYYKFKVAVTGLHRINQPVLASAGLNTVPVDQFQLWRNGKQIPIYTSVQSGTMNAASDYIEFWGEMNDGKPDNVLYRNPDFQISDRYSLETDSVAFFLTVNPAGGNLRLVPTPNALPTTLTPEPYFMHTSGVYFKERMNPGYAAVVGEFVYSSSYDQAEGWATTEMGPNVTKSAQFTAINAYQGADAPAPVVKVNAAGTTQDPREFTVKLNNVLIGTQTMDFFDYVRAQFPVTVPQITPGPVTIAVTNAGPAGKMVVAQVEMTYARAFHFGGVTNFAFELPANSNPSYYQILGFVHNNVAPIMYDLTNGKRYVGNIATAGQVRVVLEPSATPRKLVLVGQNQSFPFRFVTSLQPKTFIDYSTPDNHGDYLIITHPNLMSSTSGGNPVEDYRLYRSSAVGGSHTARIYEVDEIIDQFGFGIKKNPEGIRNFILWARNTFGMPVKNVLLMGKGLTYFQMRTYESNVDINKLSFVPTFGNPASDNLFGVEPNSGDPVPKVSIGRISVVNGNEIETYLNKVKEYEQKQAFQSPLIIDKAWMKNTANVIGASDPDLGAILTTDMNRYKKIVEDTFYGANVSTFSKVTAAPVEQASSERLYNLFQEGLGMMTYFGHSSASTLEFNLDNPDQYNNQGKYPVTIVMGCNAGGFYNFNTIRLLAKETLSEKFVLAEHRGSIAFIASSHFGVAHYLDILNTQTMTAASVSHYGKTLGEILRESFRRVYEISGPGNYYARFHCEQTTLHGDPALKFNGSTEKPDYAIEDQLVKINPSFISIAETEFTVQAKIMNLGKAINRDIVVEVKRTFPDQTSEIVRRDTIAGIRYADSLTFKIPIVGTRDKGLNKISICVDADNTTDELFETNNCITKDIFIFEDEARPVYPYNLSIVSKQDTKLIASTANPFSPSKQYMMEIDTTEYFDSPSKITQTITSTGGVLEFNHGVTFRDSTVYYWRVAPAPASGQPVWNKASFVYLNPAGPNASGDGYNQSHFYQQTKSDYDRVLLDTPSRKLKYDIVYNNLFLRMGTWITSGATQEASLSVSVNGINSIRLMCWFSSLVFNVFDPVSFRPWQNQTVVPNNYPTNFGQGLYGSTDNNCFANTKYFNFEWRYVDTASRHSMMRFMKDVIPDGHYVVVRNFTLAPSYNYPNAWANDWKADEQYWGPGQSLYHYLLNAGFTGIDSFYRVRPWGFVYKKNDPTFKPKWLVGDGMFDNPTLSVDCPTTDTLGYVTSPKFGPAKAWKTVKWRGQADSPEGDKYWVDVVGIDLAGFETTLIPQLSPAQQDFDISSIDAAIYPYLRLRLRTQDTLLYTPYQLRYWRATYDPAPEGAIAPNQFFSMKDTVEIGEPLELKVGFRNVSQMPFDSMKVKLMVTDKNNVQHIVPVPKHRPLLVNDTLQLGGLIPTTSLPGHNTVYIEANPDNDQLEQFHFNNFGFRDFYVKPDSLHPLLDVTFDGVHILNRDLVSSKPDILIKLKDEAKWMILDDTSLLTLQVRFPDGNLRRYYFNNDTVQFLPAGQAPNPDNTATINLKPYFTEDGEYELIVTGRDRSSNAAGNVEYRILFQVINKPMISNMLNYPNPFTTSTAFVFTITGSEVPQNLKIEIMTVTGRIVREITKEELGPIHIGRNITEFKWDGTDQYGSKLANGIYLYRVVTNLNGKALDKYKAKGDNTDQYFNKGYGKMYLMR